jgi:hypothetical protein
MPGNLVHDAPQARVSRYGHQQVSAWGKGADSFSDYSHVVRDVLYNIAEQSHTKHAAKRHARSRVADEQSPHPLARMAKCRKMHVESANPHTACFGRCGHEPGPAPDIQERSSRQVANLAAKGGQYQAVTLAEPEVPWLHAGEQIADIVWVVIRVSGLPEHQNPTFPVRCSPAAIALDGMAWL